MLAGYPRLLAAVELWLLGWAIVFSLDVIWMGLNSLGDRLLTLHTVADAAIVFTVVDALVYCLAGRQAPAAPYCAPAILILFCLTWGSYDRKLANYRASRQAAFSQEPQRITKDEKLWNARDTFTKRTGATPGISAPRSRPPNGAELMQARVAPISVAGGGGAGVPGLGGPRPAGAVPLVPVRHSDRLQSPSPPCCATASPGCG